MATFPLLTAPATADSSNALATTAWVKSQGYGAGGGAGGDLLSVLTNAPVSLSTTLTLTSTAFDTLHVLGDAAADYAVTLPDPTGNANRLVGFRCSPALSRIVTVVRHNLEAINGAALRTLWANETALLVTNGTDWFKVGGCTIPMACRLEQTAAQSIADSVSTNVSLDLTLLDNTGLMADLANSRVVIRRTGPYQVAGTTGYNLFTGGPFSVAIAANGTVKYQTNFYMPNSQQYPTADAAFLGPQSAGDAITLVASQYTGVTQQLAGSGSISTLTVVEIPGW